MIGLSIPLDWVEAACAKLRRTNGRIGFKKGARYPINGTWFQVETVLDTGLVMRLVDPTAKVELER